MRQRFQLAADPFVNARGVLQEARQLVSRPAAAMPHDRRYGGLALKKHSTTRFERLDDGTS
jgi:hypothetical protein